MTRLHAGLLVGPSAALLIVTAGWVAVDRATPRLRRLVDRAGRALEAGSIIW